MGTRATIAVGIGCVIGMGVGCGGPPHDGDIDAAVAIDAPFDADGDHISDDDEGRGDPNGPRDTDGDGTPDWLDQDSDDDGLPDIVEGTGDYDGDGVPNWIDPFNDGLPPSLDFTAISTAFNSPIGIDYHEPTDSVVMSVNYPTGAPLNFERVQLDGMHQPFSNFTGMTEEVKIATVRSPTHGGFLDGQFVVGDLFVGNGVDGQVARVSDSGGSVTNPWVVLPGAGPHGLMRGSLYVDRTGVYGGDLIIVTTVGEVWRIGVDAVPHPIAAVGVHLEGMITVPNAPARFGPLAGKIIAGAEDQSLMYAFDAAGNMQTYSLGVAIEDIEIVMPDENFFGVNFGTSRLLGVPAREWVPMTGDILLTTESVGAGTTGLARLQWNPQTQMLVVQPIMANAGSATIGQWEHVTFAAAGIAEIP